MERKVENLMHKTEIRVQWYDVDRANVVYFGNYFRFFTVAEDRFLRSIGISYRDLKGKFNVGFTRVEATCHYKRSASYEDLIEVHTRADVENHTFLCFLFRIFRKQDQVLLADGKVRTACVSLGDEFKVVKMPEEVFERLSRASNTDDK